MTSPRLVYAAVIAFAAVGFLALASVDARAAESLKMRCTSPAGPLGGGTNDGWMPILHFDSENVRTETGGANGLQSTFEKRSSPSRKVDEVQLVRKRDVFSLPLLEATRHATRLTQCVITATKEGTSAPFYTIIMSEVLVASISASAAGDTAEEKITLKFLKIEIKRASEGSDRTLSAPPH